MLAQTGFSLARAGALQEVAFFGFGDIYDWVLYLARSVGAKKIARHPLSLRWAVCPGNIDHDLLRAAVSRRLGGQFSLHRHVRRLRLRTWG